MGLSPKVRIIKVKYQKFGGKPPPPAPFILHSPAPPHFILCIDSPLLATFYTLSFTDYIHDATHLLTQLTLLTLLTLLTYINLLNLQDMLHIYIYMG